MKRDDETRSYSEGWEGHVDTKKLEGGILCLCPVVLFFISNQVRIKEN